MPDIDFGISGSRGRLLDLARVRIELELAALRLAAARDEGSQFERLQEIHVAAGRHLDDGFRVGPANRHFHLAVAYASENEILSMLLEKVVSAIEDSEQRIFDELESHVDDHRDHEQILQALVRRDVSTAEDLLREHLERLHLSALVWESVTNHN